MFRTLPLFAATALTTFLACGTEEPTPSDVPPDASSSSSSSSSSGTPAPPDAETPVDLDDRCASSFGSGITAGFGRFDGTLLAVVSPGDEQCTRPNGTHVILQLLWNDEAYRMVINVQSNRTADPDIFLGTFEHALVGPSYTEGWHTNVALDYADDLGVHADDEAWRKVNLETAVATIEAAVTLDQAVSVFASTDRGGDSAHLVHRNQPGQDGAVVLSPTSASPTWMLFRFAEQSF